MCYVCAGAWTDCLWIFQQSDDEATTMIPITGRDKKEKSLIMDPVSICVETETPTV